MIPWGIIGQIAMGLIGFFIRNQQKKEQLKRDMLQFLKKHDQSILENAKLRKEHQELLKQLKKKAKKK